MSSVKLRLEGIDKEVAFTGAEVGAFKRSTRECVGLALNLEGEFTASTVISQIGLTNGITWTRQRRGGTLLQSSRKQHALFYCGTRYRTETENLAPHGDLSMKELAKRRHSQLAIMRCLLVATRMFNCFGDVADGNKPSHDTCSCFFRIEKSDLRIDATKLDQID